MTVLQDYAVMVLIAGDVDKIWHNLANHPDGDPVLPAPGPPAQTQIAYLTSDRFAALAQLRCNDLIITNGQNCYYGLLLRCLQDTGPICAGDYLCAVRGTMDPLEWANNALAEIPRQVAGVVGQVGIGFWNIYASMTLNDMGTRALIDASAAKGVADAVKAARGANPGRLFVAGHSLGAALATYLTADLGAQLAGSAVTLCPYLFASPRAGTGDYVLNYQSTVATYSLVNFARDLVPQVPTAPPFQTLVGGGPTHDVHVIPGNDPNQSPFKLDPHQNFGDYHSPRNYARMLDPTNPLAFALDY